MRRALRLWLALVLLAACGGDSGPTEAQKRKRREARREAELQVLHDECEEEFDPFLSELQELDSRLGVGLDYDEYGDKVGDIQVAYDDLDIKSMDQRCINEVGIPAEDAFNAYLDAHQTWEECIDRLSCDMDKEALPKMQKKWAEATDLLTKADRNLESMTNP